MFVSGRCMTGAKRRYSILFDNLHKSQHTKTVEPELILYSLDFYFVFLSAACCVFLSEPGFPPILTLCNYNNAYCYSESLISKVMFLLRVFYLNVHLFFHQEELILAIVNDPNCNAKHFRHSYLRSTIVFILIILMVRDIQRHY